VSGASAADGHAEIQRKRLSMNIVKRGAGLAILISLSGGVGQAAITAEQLWAAWQDAGAQAGLSVTADAAIREGTSLRLSGVTIPQTAAITAALPRRPSTKSC